MKLSNTETKYLKKLQNISAEHIGRGQNISKPKSRLLEKLKSVYRVLISLIAMDLRTVKIPIIYV